MIALPKIDMTEVTRLTKAGRLTEAMAMLRGGPEANSKAGDAGAGAENAQTTIDFTPAVGGGWGFAGVAEPAKVVRDALAKVAAPVGKAIRDRLGDLGGQLPFPGQAGALQCRPKPPVSDGARFEQRTFANAAGTRAYKLYVPSTYDGNPVPLMVMLHGCTQSPDDFAAGTRMNERAEADVFLVAYPAQAQSANASRCWNWFNAADQHRDGGEPSIIAGITREILSEFAVDPARVYVAGLSAGGATAAIMGATYPDLYAAVGVHSGLACGAARDMPSAFAAMRQGGIPAGGNGRGIRTIVFHGDGDQTVHPVNGDHVITQSKAAGRFAEAVNQGRSEGGQAYTRTVQSDGSGHPVLEQWVLHGAGHAWSGGSPSGSYTDPRGPDATREMMRFFLERKPVGSDH